MQSVRKREKLIFRTFYRNYSEGKNVAYLQYNMLARCIREKEWAFQSFIIRSLAQISPRDFIQNSGKSGRASLLWINTQVHDKKRLTENIRKKKLNFPMLFWKCSDLAFNWNKGRNFIMVWSFHISFQYLVLGDPYSCRFTSYIFSLEKKGRHRLGTNNPCTPKIRFGLKVGNHPFLLLFFSERKTQTYIYGSGSFFPLKEKAE